MIKKIADGVWKCSAGSNVYFLDFDEKIVIDTGKRSESHILKQFLGKVIDFDEVQKVVFTHFHHDHIGNFDLFKNAGLFASRDEIDSFRKDPSGTVLRDDIAEKFMAAELKPIENLPGLEAISTPGHTRGSICLWYPKERILFSGDTLFHNRHVGRTDLATSVPEKMQESLNLLTKYNFRILCPGHDY